MRQNRPPNAWEVAWVGWNLTHNTSFYNFHLKPNGWELGKVDDAKIDENGPECRWPEYANCLIPDSQRFLATDDTTPFPINTWYEVRVTQVGRTIEVYVDGQLITTFTDEERPFTTGNILLYSEDAHVGFNGIELSAEIVSQQE